MGDDHPFGRHDAADQLKRRRDRAVEELFSFAESERMDLQPQLVYQIVFQQEPDQRAAAPDLKVRPLRSLDLLDLRHGADEDRAPPARALQGLG